MLLVASFIKPSGIHGIGCFAATAIAKGTEVWRFDPGVDLVRDWEMPRLLRGWEWEHSYRSTVSAEPLWILPRDNAAWMNFAEVPSLREGRIVNGEPVLVAARDIAAGEELTVPFSSDGDAEEKLSRPSGKECSVGSVQFSEGRPE